MRGDEHAPAAHHVGQDARQVIGPDARAGVAQAFAARRVDVVGAAPDVHLLLAPFLPRIVLVEAGEVAVVALVQRQVAMLLEAGLAELLQHQFQRVLRAHQRARIGDVEVEAARLQLPPRLPRFLDAELATGRRRASR